jgi:hypothetical protein
MRVDVVPDARARVRGEGRDRARGAVDRVAELGVIREVVVVRVPRPVDEVAGPDLLRVEALPGGDGAEAGDPHDALVEVVPVADAEAPEEEAEAVVRPGVGERPPQGRDAAGPDLVVETVPDGVEGEGEDGRNLHGRRHRGSSRGDRRARSDPPRELPPRPGLRKRVAPATP